MKMMRKIHNVFEYFGIDYFESDGMIICCCPIHEGDNETAFNININEDDEYYGRWFCNTKGCHKNRGGDIFSFVWPLMEKSGKKYTFPEVLKFCEDFTSDISMGSVLSLKSDPMHRLFKEKKKAAEEKRFTRQDVRKILTFPARLYLDRGYKAETLDFFDVGVCDRPDSQMYQRVVFPVYDENDKYLVGSTGRTINGNPQKWINQKGFSKSNFLYNYGKAISHIKRLDQIVLVEGQGDVIRLYEAGILNAVGMFGSSLSDAQEFLIQKTGVSNVLVIPDNDPAGEKCKDDLYEKLRYLFNVKFILPYGKDVGDMSIEEINRLIKEKV